MNHIIDIGSGAAASLSHHTQDCWEFVYCTVGNGELSHEQGRLPFHQGEVVVIPPSLHHALHVSADHDCIILRTSASTLTCHTPHIIADDANHSLLSAFRNALYHFNTEGPERATLLLCYEALIGCYLTAYQPKPLHTGIAHEIACCILTNYADHSFKLDHYFSTLPFSTGYIRKLFQKSYGVTPQQYLIDKRLAAAADALRRDPSLSVGDIAALCGFRDPLYFSKMFKKKYGVSPSQFVTGAKCSSR